MILKKIKGLYWNVELQAQSEKSATAFSIMVYNLITYNFRRDWYCNLTSAKVIVKIDLIDLRCVLFRSTPDAFNMTNPNSNVTKLLLLITIFIGLSYVNK